MGYPDGMTWDDFVEAAKALTKVEATGRSIRHDRGTSHQVLEVLSRSQGAISSTRVMPDKNLFDTDAVVWGLSSQNLIYTHGVATPAKPAPCLWPARGRPDGWRSAQLRHRASQPLEDWEWDVAHVPMGEQRRAATAAASTWSRLHKRRNNGNSPSGL